MKNMHNPQILDSSYSLYLLYITSEIRRHYLLKEVQLIISPSFFPIPPPPPTGVLYYYL